MDVPGLKESPDLKEIPDTTLVSASVATAPVDTAEKDPGIPTASKIETVRGTVSAQQSGGRVLFLPGRGHGSERPLLHYAARCVRAAGWQLRVVRWSGDAPDEVRAVVHQAAGPDPRQQAGEGQLMVVAKSFGSHAVPWAAEYEVPGIWLTPRLDDAEIVLALSRLPSGSLLVGGTADPYWNAGTAASSGLPVLQIEDADHSLEVPGDVQRSIAALGTVTSVIMEMLNRAHSPFG